MDHMVQADDDWDQLKQILRLRVEIAYLTGVRSVLS